MVNPLLESLYRQDAIIHPMHSTMHAKNIHKEGGGEIMKKKGTILGGLLLATIVTGYSVAGTYAKYVSAIDVTDTARVAQWNIDLSENEELKSFNLFDKTYTDVNSDNDKVVAPGTSGQYPFTLSANSNNTKTEVDYQFRFEVIETAITEDGKTIPATANTVVTTDTNYSPLRFRLGVKGANDTASAAYTFYSAENENKGWLSFDELKDALEDETNTVFTTDKQFVIEWYWFFDEAEATAVTGLNKTELAAARIVTNNEEDTKLGKLAATDTANAPRVTISVKVVAEQTNGTANTKLNN